MKQCSECRRRGLLMRLDAHGLCEICAGRLEQRLDRRVGRVRSSLAAVEGTRDVDWIVEELGRAEVQCRELERLERTAQGRSSPRTETLLRAVTERRDRVLNRWAETVVGAAVRQIERLGSLEEKGALLSEASERLREHQGKACNGEAYRDRQRELYSLLLRVRAETPVGAEGGETSKDGGLVPKLADAEAPPGNAAPDHVPPNPEPPSADRRRSTRRRRQISVTLSPGGDRCLSQDVSSTGIMLHSTQEQSVGDFLDLQLHTPKGQYRTTGIVVWTGSGRGECSLPNTLGVAFTGGIPVAAA